MLYSCCAPALATPALLWSAEPAQQAEHLGPQVQEDKDCNAEDDQVQQVVALALLKGAVQAPHAPFQLGPSSLQEIFQAFCKVPLLPALLPNRAGHLHRVPDTQLPAPACAMSHACKPSSGNPEQEQHLLQAAHLRPQTVYLCVQVEALAQLDVDLRLVALAICPGAQALPA